jgi:hypothetical protein
MLLLERPSSPYPACASARFVHSERRFPWHRSPIFLYAHELYKLVARLSSVKRFYLNLSRSRSPDAPHPGWQKEVILLLDLVVNRSCSLLSVEGGDEIAEDYASAARSQSRLINPVDRQVRRFLRRFEGAINYAIPQKLHQQNLIFTHRQAQCFPLHHSFP